MNNHRSRRARSPPFGYDPRTMGRADHHRPPHQIEHFDDPYAHPATPFDTHQPGAPVFNEHVLHQQQFPGGSAGPATYRTSATDQRIPSTYRASVRDPPYYGAHHTPGSAPYKILCITNINQKVSDGPVKDALMNYFSRFGDISVSICHDSGERLGYVYFRSYEEAREARHAKARTLLFDRPIEIEPIYEPRSSPVDSSPTQRSPLQPPPQMYPRRRSMTPPEYYGVSSPQNLPQRRLPPPPPPMAHHRVISPPDPYAPHHSSSRYLPGAGGPPMPQAMPMPYDRYYISSPISHMPPQSPYSSPPHDPYRPYPQGHPHPGHFAPSHSHYPPHPPPLSNQTGPPSTLRGDRSINDIHSTRSPRQDHFYPMEHRGYGHPPSSRMSSHSSHHHHEHNSPPHPGQQPSSNRRSPPHFEPPASYSSREYRRERYGNDRYNGGETEEGRPSRVLFVTNIDNTKTEAELRNIFESYGIVEDIEIRKISLEFSSALVKFSSLDAAYKAKTATHGKYLGNIKCRIAYGKISASRKLWIGGLGTQTTMATLDDEFGKFGNIINLDYISGRPYAYIEFESSNQAQFAAKHLRGTFIAGAEKKIRVEYVDSVDKQGDKNVKSDISSQGSINSSRSRGPNESSIASDHEASLQTSSIQKRSVSPLDVNTKRISLGSEIAMNTSRLDSGVRIDSRTSLSDDATKSAVVDNQNELNNNQKSFDEVDGGGIELSLDSEPINCSEEPSLHQLIDSRSIRNIVQCCSVSWFGQLVLRNFYFSSKMFMCSGQKATIEKYLSRFHGDNGSRFPVLKITQRWRLHPQPKLEEVKRRMLSGNYGMLIITPAPDRPTVPSSLTDCNKTCQSPNLNSDAVGQTQSSTDTSLTDGSAKTPTDSASTQPRPLKNLISYLEQKDAAGVISLNALDRDATEGPRLLYAFPPGDFALNLLKRRAPNLMPDSTKEEFLLGVIVGGAETKL